MKRILSILLAALLLLCALPALAENEAVLKPGRYATESAGLYADARLYLYDGHVGVFNVQKDDSVYSCGVTWAPNLLVIEHETVNFTVADDRISFLYDGEIYSLAYIDGNLPTLGGVDQAGVYEGTNGETLFLAPDGKGLLKEGNSYTPLYWAYCTAFLSNSEMDCFAVMDSFLAPLDIKPDAITLYGDNNKNLVFKPAAIGQFDMDGTALENDTYQIYGRMPSEGWTVTDANNGLTLVAENRQIQYAIFSMPWQEGPLPDTATLDSMIDLFLQSGMAGIGLDYAADKTVRYLYPVDGTTGCGGNYASEYMGLTVNVDCISWVSNNRLYAALAVIVGGVYDIARITLDQLLLTFSSVKPQTDRIYYGYAITFEGQTVSLIDMYAGTDIDVGDIYLLLREDGTGYLQIGDPDYAAEITWTESTMTSEVETITYTMNGDHIVITLEGETLEFAPAAEVEALLPEKTPEAPANVTDFTVNDVVGDWTFTKAIAYGQSMTPEDIGQTMALTLSSDGSATLTTNGDPSTLQWRIENGTIILGGGGIDAFTLTFDGTSLTMTVMGVQMIFTKD